ncbi:MAG: polyhydroxyalkanoate synthesis regulator DNA-binding domain-containing protein [Pseudomonadota bacterium]
MTNKKSRIIKRYQNRKLYDTQDSCYVTLEDISDMIKMGDDVEVIDNHTQEDLTAVTLAQIILEEQKKKTNALPINTFKQLIQSGGEAIKDIMQKTFVSGARELESVRNFVDGKVKPAVESIQQISHVQTELKSLHSKLNSLEQKLREHDQVIKNLSAKKTKKK